MLPIKHKLTFGLLMAILILSFSVYGYNEITSYGQRQYQGENNIFNSVLTTSTDYTKTVTMPSGQPLVADLDNNGDFEILIINGNSISIYNYTSGGTGLTAEKACSLPAGTYNFMEVYDIDGDGYKEIMTQTEKSSAQIFTILEYNGTDCYNQTTFTTSFSTHSGSFAYEEIMISCCGIEDCLLLRTEGVHASGYPTSDVSDIYAQLFNSTGTKGSIKTFSSGSDSWDNGGFLFPKVRSVTCTDYDDDGDDEWVFGAIRICGKAYSGDNCASADNEYYLFTAVNNGTDVISDGVSINLDVVDHEDTFPSYIHEYLGYYVTSPSVYDYDPSIAGEEIVFALMTDTDEFVMYAYDKTGSSIDTFPQASVADGVLVSNIARGNFIEGDTNSFCVMGANAPDDELDILCGSLTTNFGLGLNNVEYVVSGLPYGLTNTSSVNNNMIYGVQSSSGTTAKSNFNADEVLSTYGVVQFTDEGLLCSTLGYCNANIIFNEIYRESAVIPIDYENVTKEDFIELNDFYNILAYRDDGFVNSNAYLSAYCLNPCTDGSWKVNETISVYGVTPEDVDGDDVRARAILYYGEGNNSQDSNWTTYSVSGTPFAFTFTANMTTNSGTLRIIVQDTEHPDENFSTDVPFSVATSGLEFGDCTSCESIGIEEEEDSDLSTDSQGNTYQNNTITGGLLNLTDTLGFGIGIKAMWLFMMIMGMLMIVVSGVMYFGHGATNLIIIACLVCFFEIMMVILGFYFGIFGWGTIILLFLSAVAIVSLLVLRQFVTGGG